AGADCLLMGIFSADLTEPMAAVLGNLGAKRAFVVHGSDGLDEITITGPTRVSELCDGEVKTYTVTPEEIGVDTGSGDDLKGADVRANAVIIMDILHGKKGSPREIVLANAGACLVVAGLASTFREGAALARDTIDSGRAIDKLEQFRKVSQS
ncbi:MAG: anthranilate phosphoribosyltransferase, partial [Candidatus Hydrogenedentes bacterium]|nr:anthranilate phosphoribosyltransferase [Candidatus Hydrogenedentota bacterium]